MVLKYKTTVSNTTIYLPLNGAVDVAVDWGDGNKKQTFTYPNPQLHTFMDTGSFTVIISGNLSRFGITNVMVDPNQK